MDAMFVYDRIMGWPGIYWLDRTSSLDIPHNISIYKCNPSFDTQSNEIMHQTHAFVRAMNWWNELFQNLSEIKIYK